MKKYRRHKKKCMFEKGEGKPINEIAASVAELSKALLEIEKEMREAGLSMAWDWNSWTK